MDTYMEDYAGNTNKSRYEFLVDGSPPEITLVSPENDTVVKLGESLKINASDRWVDAEEEGIIENGEGEEVDFTVNKSFDPDWSSEGEHIVKAKVNDTLNHTQEKVYRFVADDSPPDFYSSNLNLSYAKEGDQIEISANVSDKYSDVDSVRAEVKDDTGNSVNKTLTQYKKTSIYNTTYTAPDLDSEEISVNITANDTFGFSNTATETFYLDNKKPKLDEAGFNLTRPYRGEKIRLSINTSDNTETSQVIATINSSHNPQEGKNLTLSKTEGSWTKEIVKEENGDYNISKAYLKDKVGNSKVVSSGLPEFKVVNHSITVELGGQSYTNAGTVQIANITVEFNRTIENPESRIYLPPSEPESLKETEFNNLTRIECSFGSSCSIDVGRVNGNPSYINLSGEGEDQKASISFEAETPVPEQDKNYTWTSNVKTNEQESDTRVKTPDLQVSNTYCSGSTDCNVSQFQEFDLEVETENNQTENHTGEAFNVLTAVKNSELGLERKSPEKDIVSGEKANFTFTLNISEAGSYKIGTQAYDNLTEKYTASKKAKINVKDILKPKIEDSWLSSDTVNINETVSIYAEASDNQKIENATFTLENETGIYNLTEEEPVASGDTISKWKAAYNNTSEKGEYNVTDLYVYDREGNLNHTETNLTFQVTELKVLPEVNETGVEIEEPFKILANVTGNSETVQSVEANISKPLGENETIKLQRDENSTSEYTATYRNTSQSGEYQINVTAEAGGTATNQTKNISVSYGKPAIEPLNGENSSIELPQGEIYNITWKIRAENGGLEEVNTSIGVEESTIASNKTAYKEVGDIRYINGYKIVEYKIEAKNTGETEIKLNASSSRNRKDTHTYQVNVTSSDSTEPKITGYRDYPKLVNKHQTVWIEANITDNSIIENATVTVKHPENQSNHTEDPEKMEHVSQDLYRYKFTNTTEIGHYTYEIETWDVSDNKDSVVSHSFNVSENYTVEMELDKNTFVKKDRAEFDLQVEDAKGDPVEGYNLTLVLDKNGTNSTLLPNNQTSGYEYTIKTSDPPSETSTNLPLTYKAHANVSKDGNTGQTIKEFQVTRLLEHKLVSPEGPLSSGEEFEVVVDWKGPTGEPISTNSIVYTICNGCPSDYKYMDLQEPGRYSQTFRVSQNTEDLVSLRLYAIDGYGNSESQDVGGPDGKPPIEPISVGEKDNNTASETGGGGGGAIGGSALQITRLSPRPSLSSDTEQANLSVETSMKSQCYYKNQSIERREMDTASGKIHYKPVKVVSDHTYEYKIYCESGSLNSSKSIIFTVQPKEISTYTLEFPGQLGKIEQGTTVSQPVSFYNNGTAPITIEMEATSDCCSAWFEEEKSVKKIEVEPGSEKTIDLKADIPLNTSLGMHTVTAVFLKGQTSREKVASLQVTESKEIEKLQNLQKDLKSLKRRLQEYEKVGIDVSEIKGTYKEALEQLNYSKTAIKQDNRKVLENSVEEIDNRVEEANTRLKALKLQRYIRENWWKWLLGGLSFYIAFFLITMVGIPYLRLKTEYRKITSEINASIDARKKTEKQYFRREIDRDTFMEIMTEKQDKILQLRGKKEELEEKLDNIFTELVTLENFVKAPIKSFREVSQWWESRKE
ncbi:MAG: hypothetical protein MUP58_03265 [Candidatus Nanohaloarchaeota archaeon QJJ-9]|nr:hypothetical protein [Candidatus Nanohaloarchaeota archaeon QJJ-9]